MLIFTDQLYHIIQSLLFRNQKERRHVICEYDLLAGADVSRSLGSLRTMVIGLLFGSINHTLPLGFLYSRIYYVGYTSGHSRYLYRSPGIIAHFRIAWDVIQ